MAELPHQGVLARRLRHAGERTAGFFRTLPALCGPCGFDGNGLPISFQLAGRPFAEADLFAIAETRQRATEWHTAVPEL